MGAFSLLRNSAWYLFWNLYENTTDKKFLLEMQAIFSDIFGLLIV